MLVLTTISVLKIVCMYRDAERAAGVRHGDILSHLCLQRRPVWNLSDEHIANLQALEAI